jgi:hypothetical protein
MHDTWTLIEKHAASGVSLWRDDRYWPRWAVCPAYGQPQDADAYIVGAGWRDEAEQRARLIAADMVEGK